LESVSNKGARHDRMNITNVDFFKMPIPYPCNEERRAITNFLNSVSIKIELAKKELTQTQSFKKGLLQQMFV
jgi:type I restriction enzyme S subunit